MASETDTPADVFAYREWDVGGQMGDKMRDVVCCSSIGVEHIRTMRRIALLPRDVGVVVEHPRSVVSMVNADAYKSSLFRLSCRAPGFQKGAGHEAHRVLCVAATMQQPETYNFARILWKLVQAVDSHEHARDIDSSP